MSESGGALQRIGDDERKAAIAALDVHRQAGRLDSTEFEDRQVQIARARTWADVAPLFADLPAPHPAQLAPVAPGQQLPVASGQQPPAESFGGLVPERYRSTVTALTPLLAVVLFFVTETWVWFLMIPVMAILVYGPEGNSQRRSDRRARRARRDQR